MLNTIKNIPMDKNNEGYIKILICFKLLWSHEIITEDNISLQYLESVNIPKHLIPKFSKCIKLLENKYKHVKINYVDIPDYKIDDNIFNSGFIENYSKNELVKKLYKNIILK
jgi:hypothetical protein